MVILQSNMIVYDSIFINTYRNIILTKKINNTETTAWKPKKCLTLEDSLESNIRGLLNKITDSNYNIIFNKLCNIQITSQSFLENTVIPIIFNKIITDKDYLDIYLIILQNLDKFWNVTNIENYLILTIKNKIYNELTLNNLSKQNKKYSLLFLSKLKQKDIIYKLLKILLKIDYLNISSEFQINEEYIELYIFYLENVLHFFENKENIINFLDCLIEKKISDRLYYLLLNLKEKINNSTKITKKKTFKLNIKNKKSNKSNKSNKFKHDSFDEEKTKNIITDYFMSNDETKLLELYFTNNRKNIQIILEYSFQIFIEDNINYKIYLIFLQYLLNKNFVTKCQLHLFLIKKKELVKIDYPNVLNNYLELIKSINKK